MMRVALALVALAGCSRAEPPGEAAKLRDKFTANLLAREGVPEAEPLMQHADLRFEDGFSLPQFIDPRLTPSWKDVIRYSALAVPPVVRNGLPVRWIGALAHLMLYGQGEDMELRIWGRADVNILRMRPRVSVTVDGDEVFSEITTEDGGFMMQTRVPGGRLRGWTDAYIEVSSVGEPWRELATLRVVRVEGVTWRPAR